MRWLALAGIPSVLALVLLPGRAAAYPIPPQTVWNLSYGAELVVLARVADVAEESAQEDHDWDRDVAVLDVIETWKGPSSDKQVKVAFSANMICPAPPTYLEGRRVVAFLAKEKKKARWYTVGLSYGTRYPAGAQEESALAGLVKLAVAEQSKLGPVAKDEDEEERSPPPTTVWALKAAADRATRWDGLYALSTASDPRHAYYDHGRDKRPALSPDTLAELERIMVKAPSFDETLPQMLRLLKGRPAPEITSAAVNAIETVLRGSTAPYWMDETLDLLAERLGNGPAPSNIPEDPFDAEVALVSGSDESREAREERVQQRWETLKRKAGLKPRVLEDFRHEEWTGTGAQTPQ